MNDPHTQSHANIWNIYLHTHVYVCLYTLVAWWISMRCLLNILSGNYLSFNLLYSNLPSLPLHTPPVPGTSSAFYFLNILPLSPHQRLLSSSLTLQMLQVKYTNLNMSKLGSRNDCKTMTLVCHFQVLLQIS